MTMIETLGAEIGVRVAGSLEAKAAAEAIASAFRELGLEPIDQEFQFLGFVPEEPRLEIEGEPWSAGPCNYAPATPPDGVHGSIRYVGTHVIRSGAFETPVFAIEDDGGRRDLARLYVNTRGSAIPMGSVYPHVLGGPAAWISAEDGRRLRDLNGARASLWTDGALRPAMTDRNVVAELKGATAEAIVVCAHFDSVWRGPGAIDNASGIEGMLRVAGYFRERPRDRSIIFCAFGAEEIGLVGSTYFVTEAKLSGEIGRIAGVVNLDCIAHGQLLEVMVGPHELQERAAEAVRNLGLDARYPVVVGPSLPGSDHWPFAQAGIPNIAITYHPYPEYHTPQDLPHLVDEQQLEDAVAVACELVELQLHPPANAT